MERHAFIRSYGPMAAVALLVLLPGLFIPVAELEALPFQGQRPLLTSVLYYYLNWICAGLLLVFALFYWLLEVNGIRFSALLKFFHLSTSAFFLGLLGLLWYANHADRWQSGLVAIRPFYQPLWRWADRWMGPALALFLIGQVVFIVHLSIALARGRYPGREREEGEALDQI